MTYYHRQTQFERTAKDFGQVFKFNPYHDQLGRFATHNTAANKDMSGIFSKVLEAGGGFSYQPTLKTEPSTGKILSVYPERSFAVEADKFTMGDLVDYALKNRDLFAKPDHYLGGWHDSDSGKIFLDVSIVVKSHAEAKKLSKQYDQKAYFDLDTMTEVVVNRNATSGGVA